MIELTLNILHRIEISNFTSRRKIYHEYILYKEFYCPNAIWIVLSLFANIIHIKQMSICLHRRLEKIDFPILHSKRVKTIILKKIFNFIHATKYVVERMTFIDRYS